ncbi:P1 family peptidase [Microlunatus ginsengisoli]|uniref:P1 family peptidase n=1 Tax=Microlunatus ginsengisoli TaxID=363863 RepID=A0ABP6ZZA4_9ACTN
MIDGFAIGHHTADEDGWLTGTTVVLATEGATGGVDVRGGAPGTRETDLLDPTAMVDRVDAVVLTGGSAFGLAAADGVMTGLESRGRGWPAGPGLAVPIVPGAVLFDLGRGGDPARRPDASFGRAALEAASADPARGCVGAGTGAVCGGLKGGFGYAERDLGEVSVAAAVVVNAVGSPVDSATGRLLGDLSGRLATPTDDERRALAEAAQRNGPPLNTTIGVVLTDATLGKAQATRLAAIAHDGMARAIRPMHTMFDGDAVFALASGRTPLTDPYGGLLAFNALLVAAADVFTEACLDALLATETRGRWPSYLDLAPSARP